MIGLCPKLFKILLYNVLYSWHPIVFSHVIAVKDVHYCCNMPSNIGLESQNRTVTPFLIIF